MFDFRSEYRVERGSRDIWASDHPDPFIRPKGVERNYMMEIPCFHVLIKPWFLSDFYFLESPLRNGLEKKNEFDTRLEAEKFAIDYANSKNKKAFWVDEEAVLRKTKKKVEQEARDLKRRDPIDLGKLP